LFLATIHPCLLASPSQSPISCFRRDRRPTTKPARTALLESILSGPDPMEPVDAERARQLSLFRPLGTVPLPCSEPLT
jgi:hypothetical protein